MSSECALGVHQWQPVEDFGIDDGCDNDLVVTGFDEALASALKPCRKARQPGESCRCVPARVGEPVGLSPGKRRRQSVLTVPEHVDSEPLVALQCAQ